MEIQVQCMDGDTHCFAMMDEHRCLNHIDAVKPAELFNQPLLRIQTGKRTSIFNMKTVESIHFSTPLKSKMREQPTARNLRTIPEEEYLEKLESIGRQYESQEDLFEPGKSIDTLVALHCVSGKTHYLQLEVIARHRVEQLMDLHNLLGRLTSVIPCSPEGYIAINLCNVKRIEIYPAPQETNFTAWLVD